MKQYSNKRGEVIIISKMNDNHLRYALLYFRERLQDTALSQRHKNPAKTLLKIGAVMAALEEELNKRELLEEMLMKQYD